MRFSGPRIALAVLVILALGAPALAGSKSFPCRYVSAREILPHALAIVGTRGTVSVNEQDNSLIVTGEDDVIQAVSEYVKKNDAAGSRLRLGVQRIEASFLESLHVPIEWQRIDGNWKVGDLSAAAEGDRRYAGFAKALIVHSSADAEERTYRARAGMPVEVRVGPRVRADRVKAGRLLGTDWVRDVQVAEAQAVFYITPSLAEDRVFLDIIPAVLIFEGTDVKAHRFEDLRASVSCPREGQVLIGTHDSGGEGRLAGLLAGLQAQAGSTSLLVRVEVEEAP